MSSHSVSFVIPGALETISGGYGYDRRLIEGLTNQGRNVSLVSLSSRFPNPTKEDTLEAAEKLAVFPDDETVLIDGLAFGALDKKVLAQIKVPLVALIHHPLAFEVGLSADRREYLFQNELENLKLVSGIVVTSPSTAALLKAEYGVAEELITIAIPGTDQKSISNNQSEPQLILSVGIQIPRKGHDVLLDALGKIISLPWHAIIAGPPSDAIHAEKLRSKIVELGLTDRVELLGEVSADELERLYSRASIFALATRFEGYGMVFGEAMAYGLPIVSCSSGAVVDTVPETAGMLVQPDDPAAFAKALEKILLSEPLRQRFADGSTAAGKKLISWEQTSALVGEALDQIAGQRLRQTPFQKDRN